MGILGTYMKSETAFFAESIVIEVCRELIENEVRLKKVILL